MKIIYKTKRKVRIKCLNEECINYNKEFIKKLFGEYTWGNLPTCNYCGWSMEAILLNSEDKK